MTSLADIDRTRAEILKNVLAEVMRSDSAKDVLLTITRRFDLLSRSAPSQQARMLAQQVCDSMTDMFDGRGSNPKIGTSFPPRRLVRPVADSLRLVAQRYRDVQLFSCAFNMHLLELVATAVHDMAGDLYAAFHLTASRAAQKLRRNLFEPRTGYLCLHSAMLSLVVIPA